ncbi:MAG: hypothetical protein HOV80_01485, partial [Polyangiaceae bacterium]|nr:hypothetical protein [Polyangiaceae bacterium]
ESVDLSHEGMRLRTAYLPGVGDNIVCRFDGIDGEVVALGEVLWTTEAARGGEFAVRFVDMDEETTAALRKLIDIDEPEPPPAPEEPKVSRGTRVKLHIEGLASPMKARVKDASQTELRVGSSLEFLKLGRHVDVEDVDNASRREGFVDGVRVEIDPGTSVPQLVVSLRFEAASVAAMAPATTDETMRSPAPQEATEEEAAADEPVPATKAATRAAPASKKKAAVVVASDADSVDPEADLGLPGAKLRAAKDKAAQVGVAAASAVGPALSRMSSGAKDLFASLRGGLEKRRQDRAEAKKANAPRRVTAPPPSGALTSEGKRLVRQDSSEEDAPVSEPPKKSRRGVAMGAAAGLAVVIGIFGVSRAMTPKTDAPAPVTASDVRAKQPAQDVPPIPGSPAMGDVPLFGPTPLSTTETVVPTPPSADKAKAAATEPSDEEEGDAKGAKSEVVREWGNGEVSNPKVLKVRMDGPVTGFSATEAENGFDVVVPGRKSLSTSTALVRKDKRIASLDVIPREDATEINVRFKGEAPAYLVKVRSDRIEIALGGEKKDGENKKVASKKKGDKKKGDKKK